jgi:hypothetical protein
MFFVGYFYTRRQISNALGGSLQSYLPFKNGRVVCICLTKDLNPEAPKTILVGNGPIVKQVAEKLCSQHDPIPVFIKIKPNKWQYVGQYKVNRFSDDLEEIAEYFKNSGRKNISKIIRLSREK